MRPARISTRRRAVGLIILLVLLPVAIGMSLRAGAQMRDFDTARKQYIASEQSIHEKNFPQAIERLEEAVRLCPDLKAAWDSLAWCYRATEQKEKGYDALQRGMRALPQVGELPRTLGLMYLLDQKHELALVELDKAARIDPTDPMTPRLRARAQKELDAYKRSKAP